jgi:choline dehydrogenase-like flavoprotein
MHTDAIVIGAGQSGLAAAHALQTRGIRPLVLEAGDTPTGSWPHYYDSLTLFSPARYSSLPGMPFPGDPNRYPHRDEVVSYLSTYASRLDGNRDGQTSRPRRHGPGQKDLSSTARRRNGCGASPLVERHSLDQPATAVPHAARLSHPASAPDAPSVRIK